MTIVISQIDDMRLEVMAAGLGIKKSDAVKEALNDYFKKKEDKLKKALENLNDAINKKTD